MTGSDRERDVAALRALLVALRYGSHTFTTHELAERILASDWLAAHDKAVAAETWNAGAEATAARWDVAPARRNPYRTEAENA